MHGLLIPASILLWTGFGLIIRCFGASKAILPGALSFGKIGWFAVVVPYIALIVKARRDAKYKLDGGDA